MQASDASSSILAPLAQRLEERLRLESLIDRVSNCRTAVALSLSVDPFPTLE